MLEVAFLIIAAAGGAFWGVRQWQRKQQHRAVAFQLDETRAPARIVTTVATTGLYSVGKPGDMPHPASFNDLHLVTEGMALTDARNGQRQLFNLHDIQWVSAVELSPERVAAITLHFETLHQWRVLTLHIPEADMALLVRVLRRFVAPGRMNIGNRPVPPMGPVRARTVKDNLQGDIELGTEVNLYVLPHMLIVLNDNRVQAKIDMSSVRRILAVERLGGRIDGLLGTPNGLIRLYSLNESVAFALPQYRDLAEELSYLARSPVEFIAQAHKASKA